MDTLAVTMGKVQPPSPHCYLQNWAGRELSLMLPTHRSFTGYVTSL